MIVYDDCYNSANVLGTRNIGDEKEKKTVSAIVEQRKTIVETNRYLTAMCLW